MPVRALRKVSKFKTIKSLVVMIDDFDIKGEYLSKIDLGDNLIKSLTSLDNEKRIEGTKKLKSKICQELKFLKKVYEADSIKKEHIVCSNIHHFDALIAKLVSEEKPDSVLEVFQYEDDSCRKKICVDIVSQGKTKWIKVIARNPKALSQISKGEGEYQRKSVIDHALEFIECASQNVILFTPPQIEFHFACGVEHELANELSSLGISISGFLTESIENEGAFTQLQPQPSIMIITKLNLDVTAMIAYVSALTNGNCHKNIKGEILNKQAEWERERPIKPVLDEFFKGKSLYACKTAIASFDSILRTIGGPGEKMRGKEFLEKLIQIEDKPCDILSPGGQIRSRSITVFGSGQAIQALTVTANSAFVRAAKNQGVHFDVFIHEPRSLTEAKELD